MARKGPEKRATWRSLVEGEAPPLLPAAHDGLTAKLIERAGFKAYQVGGFALAGARHGFPDIDLVHYGEQSAGVRDIIAATTLPVMVDADDCYGEVKNMTRTIRGYEMLGASAIFFEDQLAPKRCGHMEGKEVIPAEAMVSKVKAAVGARRDPDLFLVARTDARATEGGLDEALRHAELYVKAGADGLFIEGPRSVEELERIGKAFEGVPKIANMLEGGITPLLTPAELHAMGFAMVTYATSLIFRATRTIEKALDEMKAGRLDLEGEGVNFKEFEEIVGLPAWAAIEEEYGKG